MRLTLLLLLASGLPAQETAELAAGARMFRSHCAQCHGSKGQGGAGPNLTTGRFFHGSSDQDLFNNITNGIPGTAMPGVFFDTRQVWQIVAYVRSLRQHGVATVSGNPRRGAELFREQGCGGCHLVRGEGGVKGPDLSTIGSERSPDYLRESILDPNAKVSPEYWTAQITLNDGASHTGFMMNQDTYAVQLLDFSKGLVSLPRSSFRSFEIQKTSAMPAYKGNEVEDLVSYLASLKRQEEAAE